MDKKELDQVAEAFEKHLDARRKVDEKLHQKHHAFLDQLIEETEQRKKRREAIRTQVASWGLITILSAIGIAVYNFFFKHGGTH